jgi:release factor glutamine methyltransferase
MVEAVTGLSQAQLVADNTLTLTLEQQQTIDSWIKQQIEDKKPLQYLLGYVPFINLEILVEPPVLIPRPETEEWTLSLIQQLKQLNNQQISILDIATGSGCVALALAQAFPESTILATDISQEALSLAQKNAEHNNINNISFIISDVFNQIPPSQKFDLIVSNPPYIAESEWQTLDPAVTTWEDKQALVGDCNGFAIIERIIKDAPRYLKHTKEMVEKNIPQVVIEIGYQQAKSVMALMKKYGYTNIHIHKDLEGKDRVVSGRVDVANTTH